MDVAELAVLAGDVNVELVAVERLDHEWRLGPVLFRAAENVA